MKPIISPWLFYFIDKAEDLIGPLAVIGVLFWAGIAIWSFITLMDDGLENFSKGWKLMKPFRWVATIALIISLLLPSKETGYKMLAASMVTPDNITAVGETAESIIDYIVESVDTLLEDNGE